jgi:hypothetical protein
MTPETTITMPLMQVINVLGNIAIFILAVYVKLQISKLERQIVKDDKELEDKILSTVNGKYLKTELFQSEHKNLVEKVDELKVGQKEIVSKIDALLTQSDTKFKHVDKKLLLLSAIPCPFQDAKKFLLEDKD